ncbi:MAG: PD40 domain-containing protein [Candidatus Marinimicrobia bacterium]|nr:PD40 domain-containing protein [Candidatus Neomarinimicrobiota bacterium]
MSASPDGKYFAHTSYYRGSSDQDSSILYLSVSDDLTQSIALGTIPNNYIYPTLTYAWSTSKELFAYKTIDRLAIWNLRTMAPLQIVPLWGELLCFSPDGGELLYIDIDREYNYRSILAVYDLATGESAVLESFDFMVSQVAYWDESGIHLIYKHGAEVMIYSHQDGTTLEVAIAGELSESWHVSSLSPDYTKAALWLRTGYSDSRRFHLYLLDIKAGTIELFANSKEKGTTSGGTAFSPDGSKIAFLFSLDWGPEAYSNLYYKEL